MGKPQNLTGRTFHRWTVISSAGKINNRYSWNCLCQCGKTGIIQSNTLTSGHSKSCGCYRIAFGSSVGKIKKHGLSDTKEYRVWCGIRARCYSPSAHSYKYYGAEGIKVCDRWLNSFENFLSDMGQAPSDEYSLDRIENTKGYEPGNCQWSTIKAQQNHKRSNILVEFQGIKMTLGQWCENLHLNYYMVYKRLQLKWSPDKALSTPSRKT